MVVFVVEAETEYNGMSRVGIAAGLPKAMLIGQEEADAWETGPLDWAKAEDASIWTAGSMERVLVTITEEEVVA